MVSFIICYISIFCLLLATLYQKRRLHRQNIKLKILVSKLAKKADCPLEVIYKVTNEENLKLKSLLKENKKVDAVKFLKNNYAMSLLEAKVYLEAL